MNTLDDINAEIESVKSELKKTGDKWNKLTLPYRENNGDLNVWTQKICKKQGGCDGGSYYGVYDGLMANRDRLSKQRSEALSPLTSRIAELERKKITIEEKMRMPLLRGNLIRQSKELSELEQNVNSNPYSSKRISARKELFETAQELDQLEAKHGQTTIRPTLQELTFVKPTPINYHIQTPVKQAKQIEEKIDYKRAAIIGSLVIGSLLLVLAWRLK